MNTHSLSSTDLAVEVYLSLREIFFDDELNPKTFLLRPKKNTQDDPFDEYVHQELTRRIQTCSCYKSDGPLKSPDLVICRDDICQSSSFDTKDSRAILAIEVKKLNVGDNGIGRTTGLDYNSTPPCGIVRIYDGDGKTIDIRCYYLFVGLGDVDASQNECEVRYLALCDGDVLNEDFDLYLSATGQRSKSIGLGTYGDGLNRERPMFVFSNPLGSPSIRSSTPALIGKTELGADERIISHLRLERTTLNGDFRHFDVFGMEADVQEGYEIHDRIEKDSFPVPKKRSTSTQVRGKFTLPFCVGKTRNK